MRYKKQLTVVTLIGSFVLVFAVLAIADPRDAQQPAALSPAPPSAPTAETPRAPEPSALRSFDPFSTQPNTPSEVFVPTVPAPATLQPQGSQPGQPCYQPTTRHRAPSASWNSPWRNGPELIVGNIAIGQLNLEDNQQLIKTLIAALVRTATEFAPCPAL